MRRTLADIAEAGTLGDDILDEMEGEALVIVEHPERYMATAVTMARASLDIIHRLRDRRRREAVCQVA
jgi:hypothetical protein